MPHTPPFPRAALPRKKLPIGIQTFSQIREKNYYYVDKTAFALQLVDEGKVYFLSRPRHFGKNLFLDTLRVLFAGLAAEHGWDWCRRYPVIRISFQMGCCATAPSWSSASAIFCAPTARRWACCARQICPSTTPPAA